MTEESFVYRPIGVIHSPYREIVGTPIQSAFAREAEAVVEIFPEYEAGLCDVETFSHVFLLYAFHLAGEPRLTVVPFLDDAEHGVFATRAPRRPNRIGLSVVRLVARSGCRLTVAGVDMVDGTPLLDLKPYFPQCDSRPEASSGWLRDTEHERARDGADDRFA